MQKYCLFCALCLYFLRECTCWEVQWAFRYGKLLQSRKPFPRPNSIPVCPPGGQDWAGGERGEVADAVEHEAAVLPARFRPREQTRERSSPAAFLPPRPLAESSWRCLPAPARSPLGLGAVPHGGLGQRHRCFGFSLPSRPRTASRARTSTAGSSRKMLVLRCARLCRAKSPAAGPAQQGSEGVLQPR